MVMSTARSVRCIRGEDLYIEVSIDDEIKQKAKNFIERYMKFEKIKDYKSQWQNMEKNPNYTGLLGEIAVYSIKAEEKFTPKNITKEISEKLILEAQRARTYAYAPYSKFFVGCAILTKNGKIYSGCNFENAAYGSTICAERVALAKAVSSENSGVSFQKNRDIVAIAVVLKNSGCPCGSCRQSLYEFNPDMLVIMADIDGKIISEKTLNWVCEYFE